MDIPFEKICNYFKCYDTGVKTLQLNQTGRRFLAKVGFHSDVVDFRAYLKMIPITVFFHMLMFGQLGHLIHYLRNYKIKLKVLTLLIHIFFQNIIRFLSLK